jgi:hypothetical protein
MMSMEAMSGHTAIRQLDPFLERMMDLSGMYVRESA